MIYELFIKSLSKLSTNQRKLMLLFFDLLLIFLSLQIISFILPESYIIDSKNLFLQISILIIGFFTYILSGQYRSLARYIGSKNIYLIALRNLLIVRQKN